MADGRKKSVEDVDKIAQGRVWAGVDAQRLGLVDHLGGLKDATDAAAKLADLGNDYDTEYLQQDLSLREELLTQLRTQGMTLAVRAGLVNESPLQAAIDPLLEQARTIAALKDPRGLFSYCWCREPASALKALTSPR